MPSPLSASPSAVPCLAGTFVASAPLRKTLWMIDGAALIVATALLAMKYQRLGHDCVAAGFLTSWPARRC